ncbi:MAG: DNA polymerase III subunit delta [Victivallaceae bacterium]|nr:DNA polymerase III subunit delta [Victivallaceae bacterium]
MSNNSTANRLFLISGDDEFAIKAKSRDLIRELCGNEPENNPDLEIIIGDSDELKPDEILVSLLSALTTPPFLSPQKFIWLKHFTHFKSILGGKARVAVTELMDKVTAFIKNGIPEDIVFIIDGPELDQRKAFSKACKKTGELFFFKKTDIADKEFTQNQFQRIDDICRKAGKQIDRRAMQFLVETVGGDSGRLQMELDKIICFVDDNQGITLDVCQKIASRTPEALSWEFANCLTERKLASAFEVIAILVEQMRATGRNSGLELALLSQAVRVFQEMIQTKSAMVQLNISRPNKSYFYSIPDEIKQQYPDNTLLKLHPFRAFKMCENATQFTDRELGNALRVLIDTNRKLVSGGSEPRIALEQLVVAIAG